MDEVGEAGVLRADEAPDKPDRQQADDDIAAGQMDALHLVPRQPGGGEGGDQRPVEDPDHRIPDPGCGWPDFGAGCHVVDGPDVARQGMRHTSLQAPGSSSAAAGPQVPAG